MSNFLTNFFGSLGDQWVAKGMVEDRAIKNAEEARRAAAASSELERNRVLNEQAMAQTEQLKTANEMGKYQLSVEPIRFKNEQLLNAAEIENRKSSTSVNRLQVSTITHTQKAAELLDMVKQVELATAKMTPTEAADAIKSAQPAIDKFTNKWGLVKPYLSPSGGKRQFDPVVDGPRVSLLIARVLLPGANSPHEAHIERGKANLVGAGAQEVIPPVDEKTYNTPEAVKAALKDSLAQAKIDISDFDLDAVMAQTGLDTAMRRSEKFSKLLEQAMGMNLNGNKDVTAVEVMAQDYENTTKDVLTIQQKKFLANIIKAKNYRDIEINTEKAKLDMNKLQFDKTMEFQYTQLKAQIQMNAQDNATRRATSGGGGSGGLTPNQAQNQANKMYTLTEKQYKEENTALQNVGYYAGVGQIAGVSSGLSELARVYIRNRGLGGTGVDQVVFGAAKDIASAYNIGVVPGAESAGGVGTPATIKGISKGSADKIRMQAINNAIKIMPKGASPEYIKSVLDTTDESVKTLFTGVNYVKPFPSLKLVTKILAQRNKPKAKPILPPVKSGSSH